MRVTLLVDNEAATDVLRSEHGLSFLIETDDGSVLFDTGQSDAWLQNLLALGHKLEAIKDIAISHGHYDHAGGLAKAIQRLPHAKYYAHPACFQPKYAASTGEMRYIGMPVEIVPHKDAFTLNESAIEALPGIMLSGEIPLRIDVAFSSRFVVRDNGRRQDLFEEEQCMIVRNGESVAVLVGCLHRGLENNVLAAMDVAGVGRIELIAGGFHLCNASEDRLESLADFLENIDIGHIACCHCTGIGAYEYLRSKLGARVILGKTGMSWNI